MTSAPSLESTRQAHDLHVRAGCSDCKTGEREVNGLRPCSEDAPATAAHHRCVLAIPVQLGEQGNSVDLVLGELGPADARNGTPPALTAQRPVRCHDEVQPDVMLGNGNLYGVAHL